MARKRKLHNRRHRRRSARLGNPRRHHRHHRHHNRRRGGFRLFNPEPETKNVLEGLAAALLAGTAGYIASKGVGMLADNYLPQSVPYRSLIGTGGAAVVAALIGEKLLKSRPKVAAGVAVGAMIPVGEELIAMTPLGPMLGILPSEASVGSSPGAAALPAPGGVSAGLMASLAANLHGDSSWAPADY